MKNTILLIEDSRSFSSSVETAIKRSSHFDVLLAFSYQEAVELVSQYKDKIFASVTDLC